MNSDTYQHLIDKLSTELIPDALQLSAEQIASYQDKGYILLRDVLPPDLIADWRQTVTSAVDELAADRPPLDDRDTYGKAFIQESNIWVNNTAVEELVRNKLLARIASLLMETDGSRLYHDQALYKEGGGGHTPWHCDQFYWPLATPKTVTAWIPLVDIDMPMGPLAFAPGSQGLTDCRHLAISDESHKEVAQMLHNNTIKTEVAPYHIGDVSFHAGWLYHCAGPNRTDRCREVMTIIYMDRDMTIKEPANQNQKNDHKNWCPGTDIGGPADSHLNPILDDCGLLRQETATPST